MLEDSMNYLYIIVVTGLRILSLVNATETSGILERIHGYKRTRIATRGQSVIRSWSWSVFSLRSSFMHHCVILKPTYFWSICDILCDRLPESALIEYSPLTPLRTCSVNFDSETTALELFHRALFRTYFGHNTCCSGL